MHCYGTYTHSRTLYKVLFIKYYSIRLVALDLGKMSLVSMSTQTLPPYQALYPFVMCFQVLVNKSVLEKVYKTKYIEEVYWTMYNGQCV